MSENTEPENIEFEMEEEEEEDEQGFLDNLTADKFVAKKQDKETAKLQKQQQKQQIREMKQMALQHAREAKLQARLDKQASKQPKQPRQIKDDDSDSLFGDVSTPMLGRDRILLLTKVKQFKTLFSDSNPEIKKFKLKKNPSVQDLNDAICELQAIVDTGSVESFCEGAILSVIQMTEGLTARTKYDLTGLSMLLKQNKEFHSLCKILYIKYSVFSKVPPEIQLVLIISITSSICIQKNRKKGDLNAYLNSPVA